MSVLRKRKRLIPGGPNRSTGMNALKGFHAPQKDRLVKVQHPKPEKRS